MCIFLIQLDSNRDELYILEGTEHKIQMGNVVFNRKIKLYWIRINMSIKIRWSFQLAITFTWTYSRYLLALASLLSICVHLHNPSSGPVLLYIRTSKVFEQRHTIRLTAVSVTSPRTIHTHCHLVSFNFAIFHFDSRLLIEFICNGSRCSKTG